MKLNQLAPQAGSTMREKRIGRGRSSGMGKTSTRGQKGQGAHNKHKGPGFEGGQTPMAIRFPKRGFRQYGRKTFAVINVGQLDKARVNGAVDVAALVKAGAIDDSLAGLRVLGDGEITRPLEVSALHFSASAKAKIEKAGGKALVLAPPVEAKKK